MFERYRVIHFVGIGGIGMSGIAEVLRNLGYEVTGSDLKETDTTKRLRGMGIAVHIGHREENVDDAHVVVISSAVSVANPEVIAAKRKAIPVIPRAEMLAELGRLKYGILVAGAHGKTTTTSLVSTVLGAGGFDPTIVIGGKLKGLGSNARLGAGSFLVAEADESDGSFLKLSPTIAVVTNIDQEHMDYFRDLQTLKNAFLSFINKVPFYGAAFLCAENEHLGDLLPSVHRRAVTYGFTERADLCALELEEGFMATSFDVLRHGEKLGRFTVPVPGRHNVLNALAAIGVGIELTMTPEAVRDALASFSGIQRRFEFKGEANGARVYDDYGHHPTEIRATLAAARQNVRYLGKDARVIVVFQPHRYTRTANLMDEFARSFRDADMLVLLDVYSAGEQPIEGVSAEKLAVMISRNGHPDVSYQADRGRALDHVAGRIRRNDLVLTLGAGDVWKFGEQLIERSHAAR
ncbi:MAG: UDP-N-acetylmuramate--L-alanine ligase [Thermodesulfovibrionales bacterium]